MKKIEFERLFIVDSDYHVITVWGKKCKSLKNGSMTYNGGIIITKDGEEFESRNYNREVFDKIDDAVKFAKEERESMAKHLNEQIIWYKERLKKITLL